MEDRHGSKMSYLRLDNLQRSHFSPFKLQRDRLCSANWDISIEDTLARPPQFTRPLLGSHLSHLSDLENLVCWLLVHVTVAQSSGPSPPQSATLF